MQEIGVERALRRRDRLAREATEARLSPAATRSSDEPRPRAAGGADEYRTHRLRARSGSDHPLQGLPALKHKTQVFLNPEGDHFVTRLTHTMQVTQVARSLAGALTLNEPLAEAIALGHDVGHSPFGHTGGGRPLALLSARRLAPCRAERPDLGGPRGRESHVGGARRIRAHSWKIEPPPVDAGGVLCPLRGSDRLPRPRRARRAASRRSRTGGLSGARHRALRARRAESGSAR
jgi:dGTPase